MSRWMMRLEFIERVTDGDVLGKNVLSGDGNILLRAGARLSGVYIEKLKSLGVFYVYIDDERLEDICKRDSVYEELKQNSMKNLGIIVKNINNGNKKKAKEAIKAVENLIDYIIEQEAVRDNLQDVKTYDDYTYYHSLDTGIIATFLGLNMELGKNELKELAVGATLHDIGKIKINENIIKKNGKLTEEEYKEIIKHPIYGAQVIKKYYGENEPIVKAILEHHERIDGRGYPFGKSGNEISKYGKLVAISDVYNAVSNDRIYRKRFAPNEAYELILAGSGGSFDSNIVREFRRTFAVYPMGSCVKLSNGAEGYVIRQNTDFPDRPVIRILYDARTRKPINFYEIDLLKSLNLTVVSVS